MTQREINYVIYFCSCLHIVILSLDPIIFLFVETKNLLDMDLSNQILHSIHRYGSGDSVQNDSIVISYRSYPQLTQIPRRTNTS